MPESTALQHLLADTQWLRRLLRGLAPSEGADDILQDACLIAVQRPPRPAVDLRGWFATVVTNLLRQRRRRALRQQRRERALAADRPLAAPAAAELVERATVQRSVVDAVLLLREPYRSVILLRYFEDLPPRVIAVRLSANVATVHTWLQRGLSKLRQQLDRTRGRSAWLAAIAALPTIHTPLLTAITMKTKTIAAAAVLATVATTWFLTQGTPPTAPGASGAGPDVHAATAQRAPEPARPATEPTAERERVAAAPAAAAPKPAADIAIAHGRVVDTDGNPLPDVPLHFIGQRTGADAPPVTTLPNASDAAGAFTFALDRTRNGRIVAAKAGLGTVLAPWLDAGRTPALLLVVAAPQLPLRGRVQSATGQPIGDATLRVLWPDDLRSRLRDNHDAAVEEEIATGTGADGMFALMALAVRGARLVTAAAGYRSDVRSLPTFADSAMTIVLDHPAAKPGTVLGQVVDARGLPVQDATVGLGQHRTRTDAEGNFAVDDDGKSELGAVAKGFRRAVAPRPTAGKYETHLTLVLAATPLTIRGRVVDERGHSMPGAKIWVTDATLLCAGREPMVTEGLAAGCATIGSLMEQFRAGKITDAERTMRMTPTAAWPFWFTADDGAFELTGLEDRDYTLRALDPATLQMVDQPAVRAGRTDVVLTLPQDQVFARLQGIVVGRDGRPQADVRVRAQCDTQSVATTNMHERGTATAVTDANGRFVLDRVPKTRVYLRLDGEHTLPLEFGRDAGGLLDLVGGDVENVRITVGVRMHVQVELIDKTRADTLAVLDDRGETIIINVFRGRSRSETDSLPIEDGRTPVFVVPDSARTLILRQGAAEVMRHPLQLTSGAVNTLRL